MSKNILVFSDGTGQAGGLIPDENRSNIYKLFRATRCGPDTDIEPAAQLTFYDAGLGSQPPGGMFFFTRAYRWLHNFVSQATGLGITANIVDCYAAILRMWEPGDRIFLFGFSRGAYTVRCLAAVLSFCGVPTTMADGKTPLFRDLNSTQKIAKEAVKEVYQHVSSPKDAAYIEQRKALALRFRNKYRSDDNGTPNVNPYFIGVFDTVAALGSYLLSATIIAALLVIIAVLSFAQSYFLLSFWPTFLSLVGVSIIIAGVWYTIAHLRYAKDLEGYAFFQTLHFTAPKMEFYDLHLDNAIRYARHAMSIDENRADFARVKWGSTKNKGPARRDSDPDWLQQIWFAGNHSDVGGSYPENEARLSDISLRWMVHAAQNLPDETTPTGNGVKVNNRLLKLSPNACEETLRVGFEIVRRGQKGIKATLEELADGAGPLTRRLSRGVNALFGWAYEAASHEDTGEHTAYFVQTMKDIAVERGELRKKGGGPGKWITVQELAQEFGMKGERLRHIAHILEIRKKGLRFFAFEQNEAKLIRETMSSLVDRDGAAKILGIPRKLLNVLVHNGLIRLFIRDGGLGRTQDMFRPEAIRQFAARIVDSAKLLSSMPSNGCRLNRLRLRAKTSATEVVRRVLANKIAVLGRL